MIIAIVAGIFLIAGTAFVSVLSPFMGKSNKEKEVKPNSVLLLSFSSPVNEYNPGEGLFDDSDNSSFLDMLLAVRRAAKDPDIKGIYFRANGSPLGFVKAEELIAALRDFKKSGKFFYAFIETGTRMDYLLAAQADSIFMPVEGLAQIQALGSSTMFLKGLMEKAGIQYHVQQFEDFKAAGETFSRDKFSDSARYELRVIAEARQNRMCQLIAEGRKKETAQIKALVDQGIYVADSLLHYGLIDGMAQEQEVKDRIIARLGGKKDKTEEQEKLNLISLQDYAGMPSNLKNEIKAGDDIQIAIINAVGPIRSGKTGSKNPFDASGLEIASGSLIKDIRKAREDENIKAIILRIDSPGGSVIASDEVWHELIKTKKVKPVYTSMSDVAASGGYYIPSACDTIIAHPQTITGSIGVIGMIPSFAGTMDKLGITIDTINTGASSQRLNLMLPMSAADKQMLYNNMAPIYQRFLAKVAQSRKMTVEQARQVAKGRVWLGADAHARGLVDTLGGIELAISLAKRRIGLADSVKVKIASFPAPTDKVTEILRALNIGKKDEDNESSAAASVRQELMRKIVGNDMAVQALPQNIRRELALAWSLLQTGYTEKTMVAMPYLPFFQ
jgi:protease-4